MKPESRAPLIIATNLNWNNTVGLEYVEFAMQIEDEFGITVPNEVLKRVATVGAFYDAILPLVRETGSPVLCARTDLEDYLWSRVRALASEPYDVAPETVTRSTRFAEDLGYG